MLSDVFGCLWCILLFVAIFLQSCVLRRRWHKPRLLYIWLCLLNEDYFSEHFLGCLLIVGHKRLLLRHIQRLFLRRVNNLVSRESRSLRLGMVFDMLVVVLLVHRDLFAHLICMRNGGMAGLFEALVD